MYQKTICYANNQTWKNNADIQKRDNYVIKKTLSLIMRNKEILTSSLTMDSRELHSHISR